MHQSTCTLKQSLEKLGYEIANSEFFDTLDIRLPKGVKAEELEEKALEKEVNLNFFYEGKVMVSLDEISTVDEINTLAGIFAEVAGKKAGKVKEICV
jgi:glycine dehydrogenase